MYKFLAFLETKFQKLFSLQFQSLTSHKTREYKLGKRKSDKKKKTKAREYLSRLKVLKYPISLQPLSQIW